MRSVKFNMRIGITMRTVEADGYDEPRDALAQDWSRCMAAAFPEACWMPLPNLGDDMPAHAAAWGIDAIILSGGETPGTSPLRDASEAALLTWCRDRGVPVFGVCRGLQAIAKAYGATLAACGQDSHVATRHRVLLQPGGGNIEVNSFHSQGLPTAELPPGLTTRATTPDGRWIEAIEATDAPLAAVMWHPEREAAGPDDWTLQRMRATLGAA